ncbi:MAG: response regulator, partial [Pseudomonadota bacterium]|nr:response regulator [Pseudomonadota bacterium]
MTKTVLIVDDDDILRNTLARGLRNDGFYILTANSAENATDVLNRISVDAIVLDRMMTGMDGLSFLKQLRASGNQTPTIMLTAMTGPENAIDGLSGGANDYLAKPFQIRELILRLN